MSASPCHKMNAVKSRGTSAQIRATSTSSDQHLTTIPHQVPGSGVSVLEDGCPQFSELRHLICEVAAREQQTGKVSVHWGRIGERYAALRYGVKLSRRNAQGHDGRIGNDLVEIKTITPWKRKPFVRVKRAGNFNRIAVVWIRPDLQVEVRMVRRDRLTAGNRGAYFKLSWRRACAITEPIS